MKRTQLFVLAVLTLGSAGAQASFPSDAEASYDVPARQTYADRHAGDTGAAWGVSRRQSTDPFPVGSDQIFLD